ncbi:MAG: hypothetical protein M0Z48_11640 [Nitrospiraceae bacterium]|nr:hypothetical protein [Nitrospiraceae bacterium]
MKIAYLIQTHKNAGLLKRKIELLSSDESAFFIHVDAKHDINAFSSIKGGNVFFTGRRIPVYWAEYSMLEAIVSLMRLALSGPQRFDYFILSTGSDYPLRSRQYIHDFFMKNSGAEFIGAIKLPDGEAANPLYREATGKKPENCGGYAARQYYRRLNALRVPSDRPLWRLTVKMSTRLGLARRDYRKYLGTLEPYAGNAGWALTRDACRYIVNFIDDHPPVCKFFEGIFAPDEIFFHTILGNSEFKHRMRRHLCFEDWAQTNSQRGYGGLLERSSNKGGHPAVLDKRHIDFFAGTGKVVMNDIYGSGEALFARKFSDDTMDLVERIDDMIKMGT